MCAPASVTTLHQVLTVSAAYAYTVSHLIGIAGIVVSIAIGILKAIRR